MVAHELVRFQTPSLPPLSAVAPFFAEAERVRWFSNGGPCVTRLERETARHLGLEHPGVAVNNATSGLMVALRACLGVAEGERRLVAVPSFTFVASVNAVLWAGFEPVFVDVDPDDWQPLESSLETDEIAIADRELKIADGRETSRCGDECGEPAQEIVGPRW